MLWYNILRNGGVNLQIIFGMIAGIFVFVAYVLYARAIFKGTTRPSRTTWFIVAIESWILLLSYRYLGADTTLWVPVSEAIVVSVVAVLSIKRGVGGAEKTDIMCLGGAILSLFLWWFFNSPIVGLVASLSVDTFAIYPTIKKSWSKPGQEDRFAWGLTQIGNSFNLLAINQFTLGVMLYPVWRFLLDGVMIYALYQKRK